jgi:broad specificity phosphatase PhoE
VRHGETEWNVNSKVQGTLDTELNDIGLQQAELVAKKLAGENISAVYSSSLKRARITAEKIGEACGLEVNELHDFREICLGPWQGLTIDEINEKYADHFKVYRERPSDFNMPGAETFLQVTQRFCNAMNQIVAANPDKNVVIVSHGAAIKAAMITTLGMELKHYNKFRIDNASLSILDFGSQYNGGVIVYCMNNTCHLL